MGGDLRPFISITGSFGWPSRAIQLRSAWLRALPAAPTVMAAPLSEVIPAGCVAGAVCPQGVPRPLAPHDSVGARYEGAGVRCSAAMPACSTPGPVAIGPRATAASGVADQPAAIVCWPPRRPGRCLPSIPAHTSVPVSGRAHSGDPWAADLRQCELAAARDPECGVGGPVSRNCETAGNTVAPGPARPLTLLLHYRSGLPAPSPGA